MLSRKFEFVESLGEDLSHNSRSRSRFWVPRGESQRVEFRIERRTMRRVFSWGERQMDRWIKRRERPKALHPIKLLSLRPKTRALLVQDYRRETMHKARSHREGCSMQRKKFDVYGLPIWKYVLLQRGHSPSLTEKMFDRFANVTILFLDEKSWILHCEHIPRITTSCNLGWSRLPNYH